MKIKQIIIGTQRAVTLGSVTGVATIESPNAQLIADLEEGEDVEEVSKKLRIQAEALVAQHADMIKDIHETNERIAIAKKKEEEAGYRDARGIPPMPGQFTSSAMMLSPSQKTELTNIVRQRLQNPTGVPTNPSGLQGLGLGQAQAPWVVSSHTNSQPRTFTPVISGPPKWHVDMNISDAWNKVKGWLKSEDR